GPLDTLKVADGGFRRDLGHGKTSWLHVPFACQFLTEGSYSTSHFTSWLKVGASTVLVTVISSTAPVDAGIYPNAIAQMIEIRVLKFDLEGALVKDGEAEDLSSTVKTE
ncbi:hypothetical protein BHM03_00054130, partial [Ensete ventricosum]